jgi:hypothetical protein
MHTKWAARLSTATLIGLLIALAVARYVATDSIQPAIRSCLHKKSSLSTNYFALIVTTLNVLLNRTSWIVYFLTAAIIVLSILLFWIILMANIRTRNEKRFIDYDVSPYWFKLIRGTMLVFILYFSFSAISIAVFVPYDYMYSMTRLDPSFTCPIGVPKFHTHIVTLWQSLTAALVLGGLAGAWGYVWSLESVAMFASYLKESEN